MYHLIRTDFTVNSVEARNLASRTFSLVKTRQRFFYLCLLVILSLFAVSDAKSQATYTWNFTTAAATSGTNANLTVDTFKQGNNNGTTIPRISSSVSSGYTGATGTFNLQTAARTGAFNSAANGSAYFELTLTPASGYTVQVNNLSFGRRATSTGPQRYVVKSNADNYVDSLAADTIANNSGWALESPTVKSVTSAAGTALTLRFYFYNGVGSSSANTANFRIDDVTLTVNVASAEVAPAAPNSGGNQSICLGTSVPSLSATAPSGAVVDWYAASTGGAALSSGSNTYSTGATTAGTYTFYAESRNNPGTLKSSTRTAVSLTINPIVAPTIDIDGSDLQPAPGDPLDLYINNQTNQGSSPTYQWYKNGNPISLATAATYSTTSFANGDEFYLIMTSNASCVSPTFVQSNTLTAIVNTNQCAGTPPTTNAIASIASFCSGGSSNLSLTGIGASTGYTFQWQSSTTQNGTYTDVSGQTNSTHLATITTGSTISLWYKCVVTCTASSTSTASNAVQLTINGSVNPSVSIVASASPSCAVSSVTYTATPTNGGTSPVYAWYLNSNLVTGQTASTYTSTSFTNGDQVYVVLTSNYACLSSNNVSSSTATQTVTANVAASVSIISSVNPSCAGASVTFTATPTNGGTTPTYQWYNGASPISGETNATYTSSSITTGSSITVKMTSNATCVTGSPATSSAVVQTVTVNVTPTLTVVSNNNPVCLSGSATFSINPVNPGTTPVYAWYLNGNLVSGQTGTTYSLSPVANGDSVYATMISNVTCVTTPNATSNVVKEAIVSQSAPTVVIAANPGTNVNEGINITFTATPTFGGTTPAYQWKVNGSNVGTNAANYSSTTLSHGDVVTCVMTSNYTCLSTPTATSNGLTITIIGNLPFTPGNLIVYRTGDSVNTLTANATAIYLSEYTTSGNFVQAKRISKNNGTDKSIFATGNSTSEGMMTLNANGTNLAIPGYYTIQGTASISSSTGATINRVVALVDMNQNVDTSTRLTDWASGGSPRGATASGNSIYVSGSAGAVRYAAKGTVGTSVQLQSVVTNMRNVNIFNGQLYASDNSGTTTKLGPIGTGLPTTSGQTFVNLNGFSTASTSQPYGFFFADLSSSVAGLDVVYVADDVANTITKYSLVSGVWTSNGTVTATTVKGLTASISGGTVSLYATAAVSTPTVSTYIYSYTDASGYNGTISGTATKLVDRTSVSLFAFRGIAFAPTQFTSQPTNASGCTSTTSTFSVTMATGTSASIYTYQWQASTDGTNWSNVSNGSPYSNATSATLNITNPGLSLNNTQYRCVVTYMGNTTMTSSAATLTVNQTVTPTLSISTATDTVCSGSSVTFTANATNGGSSPSYQWKKNGVNAGTGSSITFLSNTLSSNDVITCVLTANNTCQTSATATSNAIAMTVKQSPSVAQITNGISAITTASLCTLGSTYRYFDATPYGTWSSSNPSVASVTGGSQAGVVTANTNGTATISYNIVATNGCVSTSSVLLTVAQQTAPTAIIGTNSLCVNATSTLSSTAPIGTTGVWSSSNDRGIISVGGVYTAKNAGTWGEARYTVTNTTTGCKAYSSRTITVNAIPGVPTITYSPGTVGNPQAGAPTGSFCIGKKFSVVGVPTGGHWTYTNGAVTTIFDSLVSANNWWGTVKILGAGTGSIKYTYTSAAGCSNSRTMSGNGFTCVSRGVNTVDGQLSTVNGFTMYPNPAKGFINLNVETLIGAGSIVVTDLYGKSVKTQNLSMGSNTVNIANLSKGFYLVSVITGEGKTTKKLIVE
jgi:hypothetical protein